MRSGYHDGPNWIASEFAKLCPAQLLAAGKEPANHRQDSDDTSGAGFVAVESRRAQSRHEAARSWKDLSGHLRRSAAQAGAYGLSKSKRGRPLLYFARASCDRQSAHALSALPGADRDDA